MALLLPLLRPLPHLLRRRRRPLLPPRQVVVPLFWERSRLFRDRDRFGVRMVRGYSIGLVFQLRLVGLVLHSTSPSSHHNLLGLFVSQHAYHLLSMNSICLTCRIPILLRPQNSSPTPSHSFTLVLLCILLSLSRYRRRQGRVRPQGLRKLWQILCRPPIHRSCQRNLRPRTIHHLCSHRSRPRIL